MWQRAWNASCLYPRLRAKLCFPDCLAPARNQLKQCGNVASHTKLPSKWHGGWTMRHVLGKRITSLESRGARNWAYSDYVYVSNIWSRHTFCMFGRRSRVSLLPMTGSLCFWGLYPVAATLRNPSWPSKGPSQWWRESLTLLDGIAKTRALPSESSCYALKTSIDDHLSHLFISIHIYSYYKIL
jgi:hypothetical protein